MIVINIIRKRGRPSKPDGKNKDFKIRMTEEELEHLNYLSEKSGKNKSEIIREGLKMYYNLQVYKN